MMVGSQFTVLLKVESGVPLDFKESHRLAITVDSTKFILEHTEEELQLQLTALSKAPTLEGALRTSITWGQAIMSFVGFLSQTAIDVKIVEPGIHP